MTRPPPRDPESHPAALLARLEIHARKRLGQNFLVDRGAIRSIVSLAGVGEGSRVLEIGPGLGALTTALLEAGAHVVAVEKDRTLVPWLQERLPRAVVHEGDALELDLAQVCQGEGWICAANLPYNVATPLVTRLVTRPDVFSRLVLMVQREVAERFVARPDTDGWGSLSLHVQVHARARIGLRLGPGAFHPRPKVDSAVVVFDLLPSPDTGGVPVDRFERVVRAAFGQRRKTLRNSLGAVFGVEEAERMLLQAGIPLGERAERLDREAFVRLAGGPDPVNPAWPPGTR